MNKILVIEDDEAVRKNILDLLEAEGFEGIGAEDGRQGIELAVQQLPALIICDVSMPGIDGYEVFELLSANAHTAVLPFIFLSARAERADVRRGMALGADDYVTKPFTRKDLLDSIRVRLKRRRPSERAPAADSHAPNAPGANAPDAWSDGPEHARVPNLASRFGANAVVADAAMLALYEQVERVAPGPISVLILGETGVGKELLAEQIHARSGRKGPFVALNCAALHENLLESELFGHEKGAFTGALSSKDGLLETADGGTLFLDEVGELPQLTQVKLLRVLEERKVLRVGGRAPRKIDIRVVSATHRDLEREAERGGFRADLFYRLNGIALTVPPLRERRADIEPLAQRFVSQYCRSAQNKPPPSISAALLGRLREYAWPGNIRELRNVLERAVLLCDGPELLPAHLPPKLAGSQPPPAPPETDPRARLLDEMEAIERARVVEALERCGHNQTQAAELLGISRRTLVTRLNQYELPRPRRKS